MSHKPIACHNVGLSFPQKVCFEGLTTQIHYGSRIALMGQNGSGKTTLLKLLQGLVEPSQGEIFAPEGDCCELTSSEGFVIKEGYL